MPVEITKIVSGGQTGADRGGLDAAIELDFPHGGWCPKGRYAEDGKIPDKYNQDELYSKFYAHRTEQNVIDSDATVIFTYGQPQGGSLRTAQFANTHSKPYIWIDMRQSNDNSAENLILWLEQLRISQIVLNVAGSRGSSYPDLQQRVCAIMVNVINKNREQSTSKPK